MDLDVIVFAIAAVIVLGGGIGVIASRNPVHSALSLVATLFGVAVLFVAQDAHFLAAVQVIVYAGAIVVLFLFVIMLLGIDQTEDLSTDPIGGQRPAAAVAGVALLGAALVTMFLTKDEIDNVTSGTKSVLGSLSESGTSNIEKLGKALFTDYLYAFEITSVLLVIAVVGAVVLARRPSRTQEPGD